MNRYRNSSLLQEVGHNEYYISIADVEIFSSPIEFDGNLFLFQHMYLIIRYNQ